MASNRDLGIADVSFVADVDLTAKQYYFVTGASTAGNVKTATGASDPGPIGILQNSPSAGQEARVRVMGFSKVSAQITGVCGMRWLRYGFAGSTGQFESACNGTVTGTCGVFNARWMDAAITTGSAIGQVFLNTGFSGCANVAS